MPVSTYLYCVDMCIVLHVCCVQVSICVPMYAAIYFRHVYVYFVCICVSTDMCMHMRLSLYVRMAPGSPPYDDLFEDQETSSLEETDPFQAFESPVKGAQGLCQFESPRPTIPLR